MLADEGGEPVAGLREFLHALDAWCAWPLIGKVIDPPGGEFDVDRVLLNVVGEDAVLFPVALLGHHLKK